MDPIDQLAELIKQIFLLIVSIALEIKELISPSPSKPTDFFPICNPKYHDSCFDITFPCRKYQLHRTKLVIEFWKETCYIDHGDQFVFVEEMYNDTTPWSQLTIQFRPKISNTTIINNYYNSDVQYNINITTYQLQQLDKLSSYIESNPDLTSEEKDELNSALANGRSGSSINKTTLDKLWKFIMKHKDEIGTIADIIGVISGILSFFH